MARNAVVGGEPAGLLFAKLAKQAEPAHEVDVSEQNPANATYDFGAVLADIALDILNGADRALRKRIAARAEFQGCITSLQGCSGRARWDQKTDMPVLAE